MDSIIYQAPRFNILKIFYENTDMGTGEGRGAGAGRTGEEGTDQHLRRDNKYTEVPQIRDQSP